MLILTISHLLRGIILIVFLSLEDIPAEMRPELSAMTYLSNDALQTLANAQMPAPQQTTLHTLLDEQGQGSLTTERKEKLDKLMLIYNQFMLRRAHASAWLERRQHHG